MGFIENKNPAVHREILDRYGIRTVIIWNQGEIPYATIRGFSTEEWSIAYADEFFAVVVR